MRDATCEDGIPCLWMRGGTSKGAVFLADDLPCDVRARDALLLSIFGSPDVRQIDGIGGADPLTSKVAILSKSTVPGADIDYLFLQVFVDQSLVSDAQGCGNILSAVGPAAIERGLFPAEEDETEIRIHMRNTGEIAIARVQTPNRRVTYQGGARIDGVPGTHAPIPLLFTALAGSMCGTLLPSGAMSENIDGITCTLIDNGMPCVVLRATDVGATGRETREELDANEAVKARVETVRRIAGARMGLGDVTEKSVPKMVLVSAPTEGGVISTRCFIPHRCHASIGVFAAVSVATACTLPEGPASELASPPDGEIFRVEHPSGAAEVMLRLGEANPAGQRPVLSAGSVRTARKLMDGRVFAH